MDRGIYCKMATQNHNLVELWMMGAPQGAQIQGLVPQWVLSVHEISAASARAGRGSILTLKNVPDFTPLKNCRTAGVLDHEGRSTAAARRGLFALYWWTSGRIARCHRPRTAAAGAVRLFPENGGFCPYGSSAGR